MNKSVLIPISLLFAVVAAPLTAGAAFLQATEKNGGFTLRQTEIISDDLYVAGNGIVISGTVEGDVYAVGGNMMITGNIDQDAVLVGGTINVTGDVMDDLRVVGGTVMINSGVGGDAVVLGGQLNFGPDTVVNGDIVIAGGNVMLDGNITGDADISTSQIQLNGQIAGNANINSPDITFGTNAVIDGNLTYHSAKEIIVPDGVVKGKVEFVKIGSAVKDVKSAKSAFSSAAGLLAGLMSFTNFLTVLAFAFLFGLVFKNMSKWAVEKTSSSFWHMLGLGFVLMIVLPVAGIISAITIIGLPLAGLLALVYLLFMLVSCLLVPVLLGSWLDKKIYKRAEFQITWKTIVIGLAGYIVLSIIPIVGGLAKFVLVLALFGSLFNAWYRFVWGNK